MNDIVTGVVQNAQQGFSDLIQFGIDLGIPFDVYPDSTGKIAYLQCSLQWVIFIFTICIGAINNLVRSCIGSVR